MRDARAHHTDNLLRILLGTVNPRDAPSIKDRHRVPVPDSRVLTLPPSRSAVIALYLSPLQAYGQHRGFRHTSLRISQTPSLLSGLTIVRPCAPHLVADA